MNLEVDTSSLTPVVVEDDAYESNIIGKSALERTEKPAEAVVATKFKPSPNMRAAASRLRRGQMGRQELAPVLL